MISNAPHFINELRIMPCLLYEEFIEDKWKNKDMNYADVLSTSFKSSIDHSKARAVLEYDICTHISYHNKSTSKERRFIDQQVEFHIDSRTKMIFESSSDVLSSDSAASVVKALKHCSNIDSIALMGNFSSMRSASILNDMLQCCILNDFIFYGDLSSSEMKLLTSGLQHCKSLNSFYLWAPIYIIT